MARKYKNKYRVTSVRLKGYDYGRNGAYFITICTQDRRHHFGKVSDRKFHPNELGRLARKYWLMIPNHFPHVRLGAFVVMPDHVHGILIIHKPAAEARLIAPPDDHQNANHDHQNANMMLGARLIAPTDDHQNAKMMLGTRLIAPTDDHQNAKMMLGARLIAPLTSSSPIKIGGFAGSKNPMFHENISRIIRWYKGRCSFEMRKINPDFSWQSRFHDHIIRNARSMMIISRYIINNPRNWKNNR